MKLLLLAVGHRTPSWVGEGVAVYRRRLPPHLKPRLIEIAPGHRGRGADLDRARSREADGLRKAAAGAHVVALDQTGRAWSTAELAARLESWQRSGRAVALMIGGPDGLDPECLAGADEVWSLGPLTLPHALVRIVVVEQLYRAWTILTGHPYHRE